VSLVANYSPRYAPPFYPRRSEARRLLISITNPLHLAFYRPCDGLRRSAVPGEVVRSPSMCWLPGAWISAGGDVAPLVPPPPGLLVPMVVFGAHRRNAGLFPGLAAAAAA
jgi:hypothetical protein